MLIDKSRECHKHKPQPTPDIERKRRGTKSTNKTNNTAQLSLPYAKRTEKHENKKQGKIQHEPRNKKHKDTHNKNNSFIFWLKSRNCTKCLVILAPNFADGEIVFKSELSCISQTQALAAH